MPNSALSITEMNAKVFAAFKRITGSVDSFRFAPWWAARERELIRLQCEDNAQLAASRWVKLARAEQQERLLSYLDGFPDAATPCPVLALRAA